MRLSLFFCVVTLFALQGVQSKQLVFSDDFDGQPEPFDPSTGDPYFFFQSDGFIANDGSVNQNAKNVIEVALPYTVTVPQGPGGGLDHVKVLQYRTQIEPLNSDQRLIYDLRMTATAFGLENHPFSTQRVSDAQDDLRLASCAQNMLDPTTFLVADFFVTNRGVWAFYERLPFGQGSEELGFYRAFSSTKRVADRSPTQIHDFRIVYDRAAGTITWILDGKRVMRVDRLGYLPENQFRRERGLNVILDHGGQETLIEPAGLLTGFGCFTLLDMKDPLRPHPDTGLVRLVTGIPGFYQSPTNFDDDLSLPESRLFGQGAVMTLFKKSVYIDDSKGKSSRSRSRSDEDSDNSHH